MSMAGVPMQLARLVFNLQTFHFFGVSRAARHGAVGESRLLSCFVFALFVVAVVVVALVFVVALVVVGLCFPCC
jgi:hypothetical protein